MGYVKPRFGPAGKPHGFKGKSVDIPVYLHKEGLEAFEYQAVRMVKIGEEDAGALGLKARDFDVWLSLHSPYAINLCGNREVVEASKRRLLASLKASYWMGARIAVFHPGFYGRLSSKEAVKACAKAMEEVLEEAKAEGVRGVYLGPETTGKVRQVGSIDEVIELCESVDSAKPVVDWAHIHARGMGSIKGKDDYLKIMEAIERRLGSEALKSLHCHYTPVEFGRGGEVRHRCMDEVGYGPSFNFLAEIIAEQGLSPVIISESPLLDVDSLKMKEIVLKALKALKEKGRLSPQPSQPYL